MKFQQIGTGLAQVYAIKFGTLQPKMPGYFPATVITIFGPFVVGKVSIASSAGVKVLIAKLPVGCVVDGFVISPTVTLIVVPAGI